MFYHFNELTSTIDEARGGNYSHGDVITAESQTAGRGQRGRTWSAAPGENLTFSVVLETSFLPAAAQFLLLQTVALSIVDTLAGYGLDARIKWPNDIYIADRKICGVLIDHTLGTGGAAGMLSRSGVGIGLNVNQIVFAPELPNPTSMALETGRRLDRTELLTRLHTRLMQRVRILKTAVPTTLQAEYHSLLYRRGIPAGFSLPDGTRLTGTILGTDPDGALLLATAGTTKKFLFREISFII
ncbi:MAG: biotin--[acetyl-CoA-carboxylase] ligase [Alistipes sp.]|jgi:BirA family biotin operon repressor/biotin-[acetyl-CoA-carboxylase] ligase|nr:biotin--[acetyl-CoA-carboxylase] ligase [Alistipes sp.]